MAATLLARSCSPAGDGRSRLGDSLGRLEGVVSAKCLTGWPLALPLVSRAADTAAAAHVEARRGGGLKDSPGGPAFSLGRHVPFPCFPSRSSPGLHQGLGPVAVDRALLSCWGRQPVSSCGFCESGARRFLPAPLGQGHPGLGRLGSMPSDPHQGLSVGCLGSFLVWGLTHP